MMSCRTLPGVIAGAITCLAVVFLAGCGTEYPDRGERYKGPIDPCDVDVATGPATSEADATGRRVPSDDFWKNGPYHVWNTSPLDRCNADPSIDAVGEQSDVRMYVTYPTATVPTRSGQGAVAAGEWPVIVFAHANNDSKCNIYRDYWSLQDHWASWGFIVVSVDATYTNCRPGTRDNIARRRDGQLAALDALAELDASPDSRFSGRVDLDNIVFAGHSRGGGSSLLAAQEHGEARGVIDIQGIDLTAFGFGNAPITGFPVVGFTAGEDVDLNYPLVEPTEDQIQSTYTWVNIFGGIHAYTADVVPIEPDDEPFITRDRQHDITEYYSTAFLARVIGVGDGSLPRRALPGASSGERVLFSHHGAREVDEHISVLGVQQRWRGPSPAVVIDTFDGQDPAVNELGLDNRSEGLRISEETWTYRPDAEEPRWLYRKAVSRRLAAESRGIFTLEVAEGAQLGLADALQARVKGPDNGRAASFEVRVEFADGEEVIVVAREYIGPEPLLNRFTQLVITGRDLGISSAEGRSIVRISFEVSDGTLFIDDLRVVLDD